MKRSPKILSSTRMKPCLFGIAAALMSWFPVQAQTPTPDRAIALEQQGDLSGAEREWELWLRDHPKDAEAFASLGVLLSKEGKYKGAVAAYRKALAVKDRKSTRLNSSHGYISYAVFCLKKKNKKNKCEHSSTEIRT